MKEVTSIASNHFQVLADDDKWMPMVEVVLVLTEPVHEFDASGSMVRHRAVDNIRFSTTPDGLRHLAKSLGKLADESDRLITAKTA